MRQIAIFVVLLALVGGAMAQGSWYPEQVNIGKTLKSYGGTTYALTPGVQAIGPAENTDDDQIFNATGGSCNQTTNLRIDSTGTYSAYFIAQPDVARNIIATFNASTNGSVKITGTDISDSAITENITISSASSGASTKAFKTVTRVDADLTTGETAKTLKVGTGNLLGLNEKLGTYDWVTDTYVNAALEATKASVTKNSTVLSLNTVDTNSAPGGYTTLVYYLLKG